MNRVRLLGVRHAPTDAQGLCAGDTEIPTKIHAPAAATAILALAAQVGVGKVWSSPLTRCAEPARLVAEKLAVPLQIEPQVREIHFGTWENRTWDDIAAREPERHAAWMAGWLENVPPGGESVPSLEARVRAWWDALPPGVHLLVAHAGVVRALRVIVERRSWPEAMSVPVPPLAGEWFERPCAAGESR